MIERIIDRLIKAGIVEDEQREIHVFGLRQGMIYILNILTFAVVSLLIGAFLKTGVFLVIYIALRRYAGGYHAESRWGCYIASTLVIGFAAYLLEHTVLNHVYLLTATLLSALAVWVLGPVQDHHKPLESLETKVYSKRMRIILLSELTIIGIALIIHNSFITNSASLGVLTVGMMVVAGWFKNQLVVHESTKRTEV